MPVHTCACPRATHGRYLRGWLFVDVVSSAPVSIFSGAVGEGMPIDMCVDMCVDMCIDMHTDMYIDTHIDMCTDMYIDMCMYMICT